MSNPPALQRWWIYQRERFPVIAHGILIAAFSVSAVGFSRLARGQDGPPGAGAALAAFLTAFLWFLQLRIADEFKDYADDRRSRPYRPVPRGLISLRELAWAGVAAGMAQLGLAAWLRPALIPLLLLVWAYLGLMSKEFFVRDWLKARPVLYLLSHMVIMPLIALYLTACDWLAAGAAAPAGLGWLLAVSYGNGLAVEIGRKIRCPDDEEPGVETYSVLWGYRRAAGIWLGVLAGTAVLAGIAAGAVSFGGPGALIPGLLLAAAAAVAVRFVRRPVHGTARWIEAMAGLWTLLIYLSLGTVPLLRNLWR